MKSIFLSNLRYFFGLTNGTYSFPNSLEGDLLKTAKREIDELIKEVEQLKSRSDNTPTFERESRYVVLKKSDLALALTDREHTKLDNIINKVASVRKMNGKPELNCVVVEHD